MSELKAYWCTPKDWDESSDVVFAESRGQAISFALARGEVCNGCEFTEIRATRNPAADKYANDQRQLRRTSVWREIGGCSDINDSRCNTCGLATMDGEWPVCDDCHNCTDCAGPLTEQPGVVFICDECMECNSDE